MSDFFDLWKGQASVVSELRARLAAAEEAAPLERDSCIRIQRLFRGAFVRESVSSKRAACVQITRVFRGHRARRAFRTRFAAARRVEELAVFHYHAAMVQKAFRGYYSRKHYHDYSARKKYIDSIRAKGDELRLKLARHYEVQVMQAASEAEAKAQAEFETVTQSLHHLVSTRVQAGVYNSPYAFDGPVTVGGLPVEDHIRTGVRDLLRDKGIAKKGLVTDANGSRRIPVKAPASRLSVQATSSYDVVEQQVSSSRRREHAWRMGRKKSAVPSPHATQHTRAGEETAQTPPCAPFGPAPAPPLVCSILYCPGHGPAAAPARCLSAAFHPATPCPRRPLRHHPPFPPTRPRSTRSSPRRSSRGAISRRGTSRRTCLTAGA